MIIKANSTLLEPINLGTPSGMKSPIILHPGQSIDVPDAMVKSPIVQRAIQKEIIAISNYCGFIVGEGVFKITVSATPPPSPKIGDLWIDIS